eukprot:TRINITY_DN359_c0_g3_i1.p2 TRINITY_DN359_c0_g3~~TRINITY_DN359_c0_g3_i1.p2  ORF type:complete len:229 (-),score=56.98 TRINITY_DN359_c0_g3_i1:253-939(-)
MLSATVQSLRAGARLSAARTLATESKGKASKAATAATENYGPSSVTLTGASGRYATAFYEAARKKGLVGAVDKDLEAFVQLQKDNKVFSTFLSNPYYDSEKKRDPLLAILDKIKVSPLTKNFFGVVCDNGRLDDANDIISDFKKIISGSRSETVVTVTSAWELSADQLKELEGALLEGVFAGKQKISINTKIDPELIGGFTINTEDIFVDLSVRARINRLEKVLAQPF